MDGLWRECPSGKMYKLKMKASRNYISTVQKLTHPTICVSINFQWHPELKIGFGYIPNNLHWWEMENTVAGHLQNLTIECTKSLKDKK